MESKQLKYLLNEIGGIVHSMNTIIVSLTLMDDTDIAVPDSLGISWKPSNLALSKKRARNYACKSAYVYVAENLFNYLTEISKDPLWAYKDINFGTNDNNEKKADRVASFLRRIGSISEEMIVLSMLLCHWRNRIVHGMSSNARLSKSQIEFLTKNNDEMYKSLHHFSPIRALENFDNNKVTLKDVSTLSTIVIKCCKVVDTHYLNGISSMESSIICQNLRLAHEDFKQIYTQPKSDKRKRQIQTWIDMYYPYLSTEQKDFLI
ncbi:MAG: hypothetical protein HDS06_04805 [Bacteroides sp.]|nr:hypothetical protein [Bacteroides sp.]